MPHPAQREDEHRSRGGRHQARRRLSQNFLRDPAAIAALVRAARPGAQDLLVEVGAGDGALTRVLVRHCRGLIAYEIDPPLAAKLAELGRNQHRLRVVRGDFLLARPPAEPFAVVGNIPFGATAAIVDWCLRAPSLTSATMLTQWEYARKRSGDYGRWSMLTVSSWPSFHWRLLGRIPRTSFHPVPATDAGILRLDRRPSALLPPGQLAAFARFVQLGFGGVGGSLHASLRRRYPAGRVSAAFHRADLDPRTVVAFVAPDQWLTLFRALHLGR
ncbi:ErmE/ErmH/ErmO/ErmR family 23S rRNA (adenine(2058)-N(6))-methyltransferase [Goodfellowiella coeruleoviolacea]|uniref:23S rRNA (Adenine-N6)-dimethyltransferase n=1 Tax=Goodfellowiella coeruleoviolacea TaxID=334858 RepID=A0AAE3KGW1_9PSEU|nr:ErmE/ErmH/ErmO/ErmR family 23S rRNA (adenine(2058)-N(6))-methyltransferase [Goodfellowiella coeruleoviolacea]MCP2166640.1 23S rRNA (adenine-N6)-dimethyltransferase [Goodfellowiella coeruleoviolacea]